MESCAEYLNFDTSYKNSYIKNNIEFKKGNPDIGALYYSIVFDVDIVLSQLGVSPSKHGYKYWRDAVFIYMINENPHTSICNDVYPTIATKYKKTVASVERAMRICFENAMYYASRGEKNFVTDYMKNTLLFPRNSEILCRLTELVSSSGFQKSKLNLL